VNKKLPPSWPKGHVGGMFFLRYYDFYQKKHLNFYVLLMMGAKGTRNMDRYFLCCWKKWV